MGTYKKLSPTQKTKASQDEYIRIMEMGATPNIMVACGGNLDDVVWQQDNARARSGMRASRFIDEKFKHSLKWPAQSPGLSPLDYSINNYVKQEVVKKLPAISKPDTVRAAIKDVWNNLPRDYVKKVIDHFPVRLQECIDAKGGYLEHKLA